MMRMNKVKVAVGSLSLGVAALGLVATPAGAANPVIKVKPSSGLTSSQKVKISGTGLKANKEVAILECNAGDTSPDGSGCDLSTLVEAKTSSSGSLPKTTFTVNETFTSGDGPVNCAPGADQCAIGVGYVKTQKVAGGVTISFSS